MSDPLLLEVLAIGTVEWLISCAVGIEAHLAGDVRGRLAWTLGGEGFSKSNFVSDLRAALMWGMLFFNQISGLVFLFTEFRDPYGLLVAAAFLAAVPLKTNLTSREDLL